MPKRVSLVQTNIAIRYRSDISQRVDIWLPTGCRCCQTAGRPVHVPNLLCMTRNLPPHLKVTPLHHSSQVRPEEIQDGNRTNSPWQESAAETVASAVIATAATARAALYFISFLHIAGDAANASNHQTSFF